MSEKDCNLRIAESIGAGFAWNGRIFHEGEFLALLDGQIIAVAKTPQDAIAALRTREADPKRGMVIEVTHPTVDVVR